MAGEVIVTPRRTVDEDESIGAFVRRRFGREAVDYLADPLLAGIHAGDVDRLSIRALFPRLVDAERRSGSVIRALRALHVRPSPQGAFVSLPGGTGELVDTLSARSRPDTVVTNARVTSLQRGRRLLDRLDRRAASQRARVVLAVPAYVTGSLLRPIDPTLADLCDAIPYASTATVAFGYRRDQVAHPLPRHRLRRAAHRRPRAAGGHVGVVEVAGPRARRSRAAARISRRRPRPASPRRLAIEELIDTAQRELSELLGISGSPLFTRLYRWTRQSPQYEVGHLHRVAQHRAPAHRAARTLRHRAAASGRSGSPTASATAAPRGARGRLRRVA